MVSNVLNEVFDKFWVVVGFFCDIFLIRLFEDIVKFVICFFFDDFDNFFNLNEGVVMNGGCYLRVLIVSVII